MQRRATKQLPGMTNISYVDRLTNIELPTLVYRKLRGDMIEVYKILHNKYDIDVAPKLIKYVDVSNRTGNRGHALKTHLSSKCNL